MKTVDLRERDLDSMDTLLALRAEHPEREVEFLVSREQYWTTVRRIETFTHQPLVVGKNLRWHNTVLTPA